jgi:N-methylhydantoinase A
LVVCLLDSYRHPAEETALAERIRDAHPGVEVVVSSEISREFREFERLSTTVLTAYLRPVVASYLARLSQEVREVASRLLVMQSNGGLISAEGAAAHAASILLSGPAGGVVAAGAFGRALGHDSVISFDMGGTSTDVCRIEGGVPEIAYERTIEGYACRLPSVAVHTVGAGGGSLGWVDPGGSLRVGPRSAGSVPGPAAYGRGGTAATVTDADLLVGRLSADHALADGLRLDVRAAGRAVARLGEDVGLDENRTALGMIEIVEAHMERAVRRVSVEEGFDPAGAALVAFGGAGGMHALALAERLGMATVLIPPHAGVLSALGLLLSSPRTDAARTVLCDPANSERLGREISAVEEEARTEFHSAVGIDPAAVVLSLDMRYVGQAHETTVEFLAGARAGGLLERFHQVHHRRNGFSRPEDAIEVVTVRATATGNPALSLDELPPHRPNGPARIGSRQVRSAGGVVEATVFRRAGLTPGAALAGPAVVVDSDATTWIDAGSRAHLHDSGTLVVSRG